METEILIALFVGGTGVVLSLLSLMMSLVVRFSAARAAQDVLRLSGLWGCQNRPWPQI